MTLLVLQINPRESTLCLKIDTKQKEKQLSSSRPINKNDSGRVKYISKAERSSLQEQMIRDGLQASTSINFLDVQPQLHKIDVSTIVPRSNNDKDEESSVFDKNSRFTDLASRIMELS